MSRPSEVIGNQIQAIHEHNRELARLNRYSEEEIKTREKLMECNLRQIHQLIIEEREALRAEEVQSK